MAGARRRSWEDRPMRRPAVDSPRSDDLDAVARVREVLRSHGYTVEGLVDAIHLEGASAVEPRGQAAILRRTSGGTALDTLIRLFVLGVAVELEAARAAVVPMTPEEWA